MQPRKPTPRTTRPGHSTRLALLTAASLLALGGCANVPEVEGPPRAEHVLARTEGMDLIRFNAGQPTRVLSRTPLVGLPAGEQLIGIDFRVARGDLYTLSRSARLYIVDISTGQVRPVGDGPATAVPLVGTRFGFDFNPAADRIRVVSDAGQNLRLHPDTNANVDGNANLAGIQGDPDLAYEPGDTQAGRAPQIVAAGYTYNKTNAKLTTNFAIDRAQGMLVLQGTREGAQPAVSPNTGRLTTVGSLGLGALDDVSFDISDLNNTALAAVRVAGHKHTRLMLVNLDTGRAQPLGTVADGAALLGMAIEP
jgi:hypothetical protein